jgi:hypothetical protein
VVAVTGMSGIGKTSIAVRYAQVHQRLRLRWPPGHGPRPERFADRVGRSRALPGAAPGAVAVPTPGDIELVATVLADGAASGDGLSSNSWAIAEQAGELSLVRWPVILTAPRWVASTVTRNGPVGST